jgi:bifunctional non-homologous end joining protein LigD
MEGDKRFVIQKHSRAGDIHWDLMLESGKMLETYRLELPPGKLFQQPNAARKIFDHSLKFLTYEGSVNKGKGKVEIADSGTYQLLSEAENYREMQISGKILKGKFVLTHIKEEQWEFNMEPTPLSS